MSEPGAKHTVIISQLLGGVCNSVT